MTPVEEYFKAHPTQLKLFKYGTVALVPIISVMGIDYLQATDIAVKATLIAALTALNIYVAKLDPEKYWEGVGAGKAKKK